MNKKVIKHLILLFFRLFLHANDLKDARIKSI